MSHQAKSKLVILTVTLVIIIVIASVTVIGSGVFITSHHIVTDNNGWSEEFYDETPAKLAVVNVQNPQMATTQTSTTTSVSTTTTIFSTSVSTMEPKTRIIVSITLLRPTKSASIEVCITGDVGLFAGVYSVSRTYCSSADVLTASFNFGSDITLSANSPDRYRFKQWVLYRGLPSSTIGNVPSTPIETSLVNPTRRTAETGDLFIFAVWENIRYDSVTLTVAQGSGVICAQGFNSLGTTIIYDCVENTNLSGLAVSKTLTVPDGLKLIIIAQGTQYNSQGPYFAFSRFESNMVMSDTQTSCYGIPCGSTIVYAANNGYVYAYFAL